MCSTRYFCPVLTEFGFYWPVFIKFPILKFHRNPSSMGRVHSCVQTDMAKVVDVTVRRSLSHKRHSTRCICNTKVTPIMPLWSIIILYSEKDTKHTNTFCGQAQSLWTPWAECIRKLWRRKRCLAPAWEWTPSLQLFSIIYVYYWDLTADPSGPAVYVLGVRPLACWVACLLSVVCCQEEVSKTGWSLVQRSPTTMCRVSVWLWSLDTEGAVAP